MNFYKEDVTNPSLLHATVVGYLDSMKFYKNGNKEFTKFIRVDLSNKSKGGRNKMLKLNDVPTSRSYYIDSENNVMMK